MAENLSLETSPSKSSGEPEANLEGENFYDLADYVESRNNESRKTITVGDYLPAGPRLYYETSDNVVRMKDIGFKKRILVVGVIGSFTPDCWNRHLYLVLEKLKYFEERDVDFIACVATNDPYTHRAWGAYLGCQETVLMWADTTKRFTRALGMDIVVPWLDDSVRSRRYVILADDMLVTKMLVAPEDHLDFAWHCEHFTPPEDTDETEDEEQ